MAALNSRASNRVRSPPLPAPRAASLPQAKALWAYSGEDSDDLAFEAGDIVEIVEETNADWWTGRVNGKQGLFPSAYVERLAQAPAPGPSAAAPKAYRPFGAALHGSDLPPPSGQGINSLGLQEKAGTEQKKDKYGQYKSTVSSINVYPVDSLMLDLILSWLILQLEVLDLEQVNS
ncbi:SH3 domain-containing protein [Gymnopilus junonius]|uniref:SH3 domain-containing protein n=1 Tax=Gymnopilus junonius TaxID=109634 RepID=A0A9P5NSF5_GYMJU|nr:SH3 domain-containing protein [Gymnopilus junonius]